jgi:hypothetical protein
MMLILLIKETHPKESLHFCLASSGTEQRILLIKKGSRSCLEDTDIKLLRSDNSDRRNKSRR